MLIMLTFWRQISPHSPFRWYGFLNCCPRISRRSLGSGHAFTAQWTCVHRPVNARSLPSERWEVCGKRLGMTMPEITLHDCY